MRRRDLRESVMGSAADQKRKAGCDHRWVKLRGVLFGYMVVRGRCRDCGTYREKRA